MTIRERKYNLSENDYLALFEAQGGRCGGGCHRPFGGGRMPNVDHDHRTGLVRGLLCYDCNTELGLKHDNADWFARQADYLRNPPSLDAGVEVYVPGSPGAEGVKL